MKRSNFRWPLVLEAPVEVADGAGGVRRNWIAQGTLYAKLEALTGREALSGESGVSRQPWKITVPAAPQGAASRPTARQRFRHDARIFMIASVADADSTGRFLTCRATEETTV